MGEYLSVLSQLQQSWRSLHSPGELIPLREETLLVCSKAQQEGILQEWRAATQPGFC